MKLHIPAATGLMLASLASATASAQVLSLPSTFLGPTTGYGTLGYTFENRDTRLSPTTGSVTGRLGARFGPFLGVESEYSYGVDDDHTHGFKTSTENQYAGYGVAYLPLRRNFDLFARVGYGAQDLRVANETVDLLRLKGTVAGVNYGAGAQWFFRRQDGVRFDYTRYDPSDRGISTADTYGVSYIHRF